MSRFRSDHYHPDLRAIARVLPRSPFNRVTLPAMRALTRFAPSNSRGVEVLAITHSAVDPQECAAVRALAFGSVEPYPGAVRDREDFHTP